MKRNITSLLLAGLLLAALTACGDKPAAPSGGDNLTIAATTYPVYLFTTAVTQGVEGVEVKLLVNQQTSCLHDYTLTVNDMKVIEGADVIVLNGAGLEDFMDDALAASGAAVIDCSQGIGLLPYAGHADHDHGEDEDEGDHYDPHIWMCEENAAVMMNNIAHGLGALDAAHLDTYTENSEAAAALLPADPLADGELACPYLITFHDGFHYFAQDNGLTLLKSIEEEEGSEASAADIREIISLIGEYDIPAIFTEVNGSDATAQAIARETGCKVYTLDMIMSGDGTGIQPYVDAMNANYDTILQALGGN